MDSTVQKNNSHSKSSINSYKQSLQLMIFKEYSKYKKLDKSLQKAFDLVTPILKSKNVDPLFIMQHLKDLEKSSDLNITDINFKPNLDNDTIPQIQFQTASPNRFNSNYYEILESIVGEPPIILQETNMSLSKVDEILNKALQYSNLLKREIDLEDKAFKMNKNRQNTSSKKHSIRKVQEEIEESLDESEIGEKYNILMMKFQSKLKGSNISEYLHKHYQNSHDHHGKKKKKINDDEYSKLNWIVNLSEKEQKCLFALELILKELKNE